MADKDQSRYEHKFEDLSGNTDDAVIEGNEDDREFELVDDEKEVGKESEEQEGIAKEGQEGEEKEDHRGQELASIRKELAQLKAEQSKSLQAREAGQAREAEQASERLEAEIADVRKKIEESYETGETGNMVELQEKFIDLRLSKAQQSQKTESTESTEKTESTTQPEIPAATRRWLDKNSWYMSGENIEARDTAAIVEQQLLRRGMDPQSDDFYKSLDKQVQRMHPELSKSKASTRSSGPTNGMGSQGAATSGKVKITADDRAQMKQFGLDPDDPKQLTVWAREKKALDAKENRR